MNISKLPKEIQLKIKAHQDKISELSSAELLEYSKNLYKIKEDLGKEVTDFLFNEIDKRTAYLNSGHEKVKVCADAEMIKKFKK